MKKYAFLFQILAEALSGIFYAERIKTGPGEGAEKQAIAVSRVDNIVGKLDNANIIKSSQAGLIREVAPAVVDATVGLLNAFGALDDDEEDEWD